MKIKNMIFGVIVATTLFNTLTVVVADDYNVDWKEKYIGFINDNINKNKIYEDYYYTLINVNNDSIPELYIAPNSGIGGDIICSYYNGDMIYERIGVGDGIFRYIEGKNLFIESGGRMDTYSDKVYSIENGKFVVKCDGQYGASDNTNVKCDQYGNPIYEYFINGVRVADEKEYEKCLNAVFNEQQAIEPIYANNKYDSNLMRYVGEGIYDRKEILKVIDNYDIDKNKSSEIIDSEKLISVILNGKELSFDVKPYIENGTTRVPMRKIFESLGAAVEYDASTKTITACKGSAIIELVTGASTARINGREMTLTTSVENKNGSTMVPLRFVSEALGAEVIWDGETKTITINLAEDKADKEHLVNNPITGHSNVILTIYDNRNNILDGIMWTTANWADGTKHLINIEEEVSDVEQGKGVLASILANVPEIESEPMDTSKYTNVSGIASDGASIVENYFGTSTKETKLLQNSIEKLGDVIDWTAFSIEEIDFLLRDYKKNIQYFVLLQSNCNDEYVNAIIDDLMQDYTDKWYKTIIDLNEKIADEVVDKGIDASAGFYTAGLYPVVKYSSELISTTTGLKSKTDALANFYQVCRMINPVDETLEKCLIKYKNGECSESDWQAAFELNKATKIYAYECITKFGNPSDVDRAYANIQDIKKYVLKNGEIVYCGGAGGGSMGGR